MIMKALRPISTAIALFALLTACGGGVQAGTTDATNSGNAAVSTPAAPTSVSVAVSPSAAALQVGQSLRFSASVSGTRNTGVKWLVNGTQGGNSSVGTITSAGSYTAPATVPSGGGVTITAKSVADPTRTSSATVSLAAAPTLVTVSLTPTTATVAGGNAQQFKAAVAGTTNTSVTWLVNGVTGGSATYGTITTTGLYTAPACPSVSNATVSAVSVYDTTAKANGTVTITVPSTTTSPYDRYVATNGNDSNDGSACRPWATVQRAASLVTAGMTVHVRPGTYNQSISSSRSGTATARIRFVSTTPGGAHIVAGTTNVWYNSGSYVDIEGFDVSGGTTIGIKNSGSYVRVRYNTVHDIGTGTCPQGGAISDGNYTTALQRTYAEYSNNLIYKVGLWPPGTCNKAHGIYLGHGNGIARNNVIALIAGSGIHSYHDATDSIITNNTIVNSNDGVLISAAPGFTNANSYVANNIVSKCLRRGYGADPYNGTVTNYTFTNNLVFSSGTNWYHIASHPNSVEVDPMFLHYTGDITGDYHLQSASSAINRGILTNAPNTDFDGIARPQGTAIDMGAFEWHQ